MVDLVGGKMLALVLAAAQVKTSTNDWDNPVLWIIIAVVIAAVIFVGYILIRRPFSRHEEESPRGGGVPK
jgi:Kef-type K+ transport system membrane component KefB